MARPRKNVTTKHPDDEMAEQVVSSMVSKKEPVNISEMPLESLGDYLRYNKEARKLNKELRICRYKIKQCPVDLHPKERIVFGRNDQPGNPLPVYLSNEMIHFELTLYPGKTYDLPRCIVEYLASKGTAVWTKFENPDGTVDSRSTAMDPRFSLRTLYKAS